MPSYLLKFKKTYSVKIGGRRYPVVKIGNQLWMAENLDYKFDGCSIGVSGLPSTPAAWYYDNDEDTYGIDGPRQCGLLYNWYAAQLLNDNRRSLCPGWHLPSLNDYESLCTFVGASIAGTLLKSSDVSWAPDWGGTDEYSFGILPTGMNNGSFAYLGQYTDFKTTTTNSNGTPLDARFSTGTSYTSITNWKTTAGPIRLIKDAT